METITTRSPIARSPDGVATWTHRTGDTYAVTGRDVYGRRFAPIRCGRWAHARGINICNGSRWLIRDGRRFAPIRCGRWAHARGINICNGSRWLIRDGRRYLIERVRN